MAGVWSINPDTNPSMINKDTGEVTFPPNQGADKTYTITYKEDGHCGQKEVLQKGSGGGGSDTYINIKYVNTTDRDIYFNGQVAFGIYGPNYPSDPNNIAPVRFNIINTGSYDGNECAKYKIPARGSARFTYNQMNISVDGESVSDYYGGRFITDVYGQGDVNPLYTQMGTYITSKGCVSGHRLKSNGTIIVYLPGMNGNPSATFVNGTAQNPAEYTINLGIDGNVTFIPCNEHDEPDDQYKCS